MNYQELVDQLNIYSKLYAAGTPQISDEEYDNLYDKLIAIETEQGWAAANSPTKNITDISGRIKHPHRLYSLDKIYSVDTVPSNFTVKTPKIDGVNVSLTYKSKLIMALTRGDGEYGESILNLVKDIPSIPASIPYIGPITIVGEMITRNIVENFRNYVAGALHKKESDPSKNLEFIVHDVLGSDLDYLDRLQLAQMLGFSTVLTAGIDGIPQDGIVYRVNSRKLEKDLGYTSKYPKFALALKQKNVYTGTSHLQNIEWVVGRSGVVTPVGVIEPIVLDDATISRVILHNIEFIENHKLGRGDKILIERRITPQFVRVVEHSQYPRFDIYDVERELKCEVQRKGPRLYVNDHQNYRAVEYFAKTLRIMGLGSKSIKELDIKHPLELYNPQVKWVDVLGKNGEKIVNELYQDKPYYLVLAALGIPGVGVETAKLITKEIPSFDDLETIEHKTIRGVGQKTIQSVLDWLLVNKDWVYKLPYKLSATPEQEKLIIDKKYIAITGKLDMSKSALADILQQFGFEVKESVTKNTYALISSGEDSIKTQTALKYNVKIIDYWKNKKSILKGEI